MREQAFGKDTLLDRIAVGGMAASWFIAMEYLSGRDMRRVKQLFADEMEDDKRRICAPVLRPAGGSGSPGHEGAGPGAGPQGRAFGRGRRAGACRARGRRRAPAGADGRAERHLAHRPGAADPARVFALSLGPVSR
jgi:hypothetical protein